MTPGKGARHLLGVLVLIAAVVAVLALIVTGILSHRTAYFEQRNLRELDRIATELTETKRNLAQTAALHFVPRQLHFSLSARFECLAATAEVMGARQQPMTIVYYFTDPQGSDAIARWYADQTAVRTTSAAGRPPSIASQPLPSDFCGYQRPLGLPLDPEKVSIDEGRITVERTTRLTSLLWPMTSHVRDRPQDPGPCLHDPARRVGAEPAGDARSFIRNCFLAAALEDMDDETYSNREPGELRAVVARSIDAALRSNTVRINVATGTDAVDLDSALELFDAVQIVGSDRDRGDRPLLLHQAGRVPAAVEGDDGSETQWLSAISSLTGSAAARPAAPAAGHRDPGRERQGDLLGESRIVRTRDLILFERTVPHLAGLYCKPCLIVGIVRQNKFNGTVRKIDGVQATIFLIGVLTLIALTPLLQLRLRRRLDAIGRGGQYMVWFSLTLLAASAAVSVLAIWSSSASRHAGASYARDAAAEISGEFDLELRQTLPLIGRIGAQLAPSDALFPAPETLPRPTDLVAGSAALDRRSGSAAVATLARALEGGSASILEAVSYYRGDGFLDRDWSRLAVARFPGFGIDLGNRPYFNRARNRSYDAVRLADCPNRGAAPTQFILDRVFALTDGAPRMIWLLPARNGCAPAPAAVPNVRQAAGGAGADERTFYDPTAREYLVASGTLRTFLRTNLRPGFNYAVVATDRPSGEPNVLFHSRPGAALVERFQHELDDPEHFDTLVSQALAPNDQAPEAAARTVSVAGPAPSRLDTNYRARSARLTVTRLNPHMSWILVIIEDRDDAGFAIWRAATFGYAIWFIAALALGLGLLFGHLRGSPSLDRRPGLSLWPRLRLSGFTPPRLARKADLMAQLAAGAAKRDRHIGWVLFAGLIGVPAAEGASRVLLAFAAAMTALAARAYFRGMTTEDDGNARRSGRWTIGLAFVLLALAVIVFFLLVLSVGDDDFRAVRQASGRLDWSYLRTLLFIASAILLARSLIAAARHTGETEPSQLGWWQRLRAWIVAGVPNWRAPARWAGNVILWLANVLIWPKRMWLRFRAWIAAGLRNWRWPARWAVWVLLWLPWRALRWLKALPWELDIGWMALLFVLGAIPAAAGFLDSYDQDRFLVAERDDQLRLHAREERRRDVEAINLGRIATLPDRLRDQIVETPLPSRGEAGSGSAAAPWRPPAGPARVENCYSLSCIAIFYLDLGEQALEYSDFAPFRMGFGEDGALSGAQGYARSLVLPFIAAIPLIVLCLAFMFFRQQYFHRPPLLSPGKDPDFDPPLSYTRKNFIDKALLRAADGKDPTLLFRPAGGTRHLIVGIGMDLRQEWGGGKRLSDVPGIEWVDLLNLAEVAETRDASNENESAKTQPSSAIPAATTGESEPVASGGPQASKPVRAVVIGNLDLALQIPDGGETADRAFRTIKAWSDWLKAQDMPCHMFVLADIDPLDRIALLWEQQDREEKTSLIKSWRWAELIQDFTMLPICSDPSPMDKKKYTRVVRTIREELGMLDIGFARELRDQLVERMKKKPRPDTPASVERIVSFITEQMSDHYQKLWASSSDEERVMLYRTARDCHLKMHDSRGLRSLLARGLLVRVPEYRLMNRSFTRYVCRVGATSEIHRSAERVDGLDWVWPLIRYPLIAAAGGAVLLLQFLAPSTASGAVGALPALLAVIPALVGKWFQGRPSAT